MVGSCRENIYCQLVPFAQRWRYLQTLLWTIYIGATFYWSNTSNETLSMFYGLVDFFFFLAIIFHCHECNSINSLISNLGTGLFLDLEQNRPMETDQNATSYISFFFKETPKNDLRTVRPDPEFGWSKQTLIESENTDGNMMPTN